MPVLDLEVFNELYATLGRSPERVRNVYTKFLDSSAQRVEELRHEPAAREKTLHALKGSAGMVGASRLAALAARLHDEGLSRGMLAAEAIEAIEVELAEFRRALQAQLSVTGEQESPGTGVEAG